AGQNLAVRSEVGQDGEGVADRGRPVVREGRRLHWFSGPFSGWLLGRLLAVGARRVDDDDCALPSLLFPQVRWRDRAGQVVGADGDDRAERDAGELEVVRELQRGVP